MTFGINHGPGTRRTPSLMRTDAFRSVRESSSGPIVYFGLFDNCNVRCNMCNCWQLPRSKDSTEDLLQILDRVLDWNPSAIRFTGGEPLLHRGLPKLIQRARNAGAHVSVISNGRILASRIQTLLDSGCQDVILSLDGFGRTHDSIRGLPGLFERCQMAIELMHAKGMPFAVNTVIQKQNVDVLDELADYLLEENHAPWYWHLIPVRGYPLLTPNLVSLRDLEISVTRWRVLATELGTELITEAELFSKPMLVSCDVPEYVAYVRADTGDVFGCNMLVYTEPPIGNLRSENPITLWSGDGALNLRQACASGTNDNCIRCDTSSRKMNVFLRDIHIRS